MVVVATSSSKVKQQKITVKTWTTLGTTSIVAAGAVVTKDVPPYQIVAGLPAEPLRPRFPPEIVERLLELAWWDWDHETLRSRLSDFRALPVTEFLEKYAEARAEQKVIPAQ